MMTSLKALRESYQEEVERAANLAKTANSNSSISSKISHFSHFSRELQNEDELELQFLRDERAAIREYDAGMNRSKAEYLSILDVPCLPKPSKKYITEDNSHHDDHLDLKRNE